MIIHLGFILISCIMAGNAQESWKIEDYPDPRTDPTECGRDQSSYICDPNHLLSTADGIQLEHHLAVIRNNTKCACSPHVCDQNPSGYKISVALLKKLDVGDNANTLRPTLNKAMEFAYQLLTMWNHGSCGEDMVILYSAYNNVFCTVTGSVAGKVLQSDVIGEISWTVRNYFTADTLYLGLDQLTSKYNDVFRGTFEPKRYPVTPQAVIGKDSGSGSLTSSAALLVPFILSALYHMP